MTPQGKSTDRHRRAVRMFWGFAIPMVGLGVLIGATANGALPSSAWWVVGVALVLIIGATTLIYRKYMPSDGE